MEWHSLTGNLPALIAVLTALAALLGAWLRLRPRRVVGWLAAVKERETLLAMLNNEKAWGTYWKTQADQCFDQLKERRK